MDITKSAAIALSLIAAILVMVAAKSCTDDIDSSNKRSRMKNGRTTSASTETPPKDKDFSKYTPVVTETQTTAEVSTEEVATSTNMFGEVVATFPMKDGEIIEVTTVEKSILEAYNDSHTESPEVQQETEPEFDVSGIEPATNIVIDIF